MSFRAGAMGAPPVAEASDLSEWQRSVCNAGAPSPRRTQGTATVGVGIFCGADYRCKTDLSTPLRSAQDDTAERYTVSSLCHSERSRGIFCGADYRCKTDLSTPLRSAQDDTKCAEFMACLSAIVSLPQGGQVVNDRQWLCAHQRLALYKGSCQPNG